jgi:hypothetical protein
MTQERFSCAYKLTTNKGREKKLFDYGENLSGFLLKNSLFIYAPSNSESCYKPR